MKIIQLLLYQHSWYSPFIDG